MTTTELTATSERPGGRASITIDGKRVPLSTEGIEQARKARCKADDAGQRNVTPLLDANHD